MKIATEQLSAIQLEIRDRDIETPERSVAQLALAKLIGDVPAATAIPDRFPQAAEVVEITGRSFRLKNGGRANDDEKKNRKKSDASDSAPADEEKL